MLVPKQQTEQSTDLHDYQVRIIVAGSRGYNNKQEFHECIIDYLDRFDKPVLFISGAAPSGADDLIIQWCKKFNYPCKEMPADWDNLDVPSVAIKTNAKGKQYNAAAGHQRNEAMAEVASHLICFYNGHSPGTKRMIEIANEKLIPTRVIIIKKENR